MGISVALAASGFGHRVLIEDCEFQFLMLCLQHFQAPIGALHDLAFRRNVILDSYSGEGGHCQGFFCHGVTKLLLEENIFDHNGWYDHPKTPFGRATMFNHNTYYCDNRDIVFRGNMFLRSSSIGTKWTANTGRASTRDVVIDDNLFADGEIGMSIGGNDPGPLRFKNVRVTNNVLTDIGRSQPTRRKLAWYLQINDWDGGLVAHNLFLHQPDPQIDNVSAIHVDCSVDPKSPAAGPHCRNVTIRDNVIHGLNSAGPALICDHGHLMENVRFQSNTVQFPGLKTSIWAIDAPASGVSLAGNCYFSRAKPEDWFRIGQRQLDFDAWTAKTGEKDWRNASKRPLPTPREPSRPTWPASSGRPVSTPSCPRSAASPRPTGDRSSRRPR